MKSIRGGMGLGDALYVQSVARYYVEKGEKLEVCTAWPDVFEPLKPNVRFAQFRRNNIKYLAHYSLRKKYPKTTQFQDCCIQAGIKERVDLRLDWKIHNHELVDRLRQRGKPIVCVQLPRNPMNRKDGFGKEILPNCDVIQKLIDGLKGEALIVQIGAGQPLYQFKGIDVDLSNQTSVKDLLDVGRAADGFVGYCSYIVPLAESFDTPAALVWSRRGLKARHSFIRRITPQKILEKGSSRYVIDDDPDPTRILAGFLRPRAVAPDDPGEEGGTGWQWPRGLAKPARLY